MRKWIILLLAGSMFASCGNAQNKVSEPSLSKEMEKKDAARTIKMTKADFIKKVADYENKPNEWKYLGDKPAIVDFYADWCGPCRSISPVLEELAAEYKDQIYIYKVNTDKEQDLSAAMGIVSLPSLLFIPLEGQPRMATGAMPKQNFTKIIEEFLLKSNTVEK